MYLRTVLLLFSLSAKSLDEIELKPIEVPAKIIREELGIRRNSFYEEIEDCIERLGGRKIKFPKGTNIKGVEIRGFINWYQSILVSSSIFLEPWPSSSVI